MLTRIDSFSDFFALNEHDRASIDQFAANAAERATSMTQIKDYEALAAILLKYKPQRIFEIGTYLGVTSDFFLELLPTCKVVSIAYPRPAWHFLSKRYNNTDLTRKEIGSKVSPARRSRFIQLYGDSHKLRHEKLLESHGQFDMVFVDGDHSRDGVLQDTELAQKIIPESGVICWHDANPKAKYMDVRHYLEDELPLNAMATKDDYTGGIACWSAEIEKRMHGSL